jgi:uncharacterized membrane protein
MSDLYAIGYPNLLAAEEVVQTLARLQSQRMIQVDDAVIVERRGGGKVKLHRAGSDKSGWAGLIGQVFFGPRERPVDTGIDDDFTRNLGAQLDAGNVALIMLVSSIIAEKVFEELHGQHSGHIMQTSLDRQTETTFPRLAALRADSLAPSVRRPPTEVDDRSVLLRDAGHLAAACFRSAPVRGSAVRRPRPCPRRRDRR